MASGPLAAHTAIGESPGHRKNLLDPAFERVGFGLARQGRDGGTGSDVLVVGSWRPRRSPPAIRWPRPTRG